jgi:hypothetical protein
VGVCHINRGASNGSPGDNDEQNREQKVLIHSGKDTLNAHMVTASQKSLMEEKQKTPPQTSDWMEQVWGVWTLRSRRSENDFCSGGL